jgi:hypothetical protein
MTILYSNDNPIKSEHIATMRYDKKGYVRNDLRWCWEDAENKNNTSVIRVPGVVVEFPWSNTLTEKEKEIFANYKNDRLYPCMSGPDMFPSAKEYMIYNMFCGLMGARGRLLVTNEPKSSIFFEQNDKLDETRIANLLIKLERFADMIEYGFTWLVSLLDSNDIDGKYDDELKKFKTTTEDFYNNEILPYSTYKMNFYEWNLINFIVPKEPVGTWIPDDNDNVELLKESREKVFGKFSQNANLKKVYFDLYDLCLDGIVDFQWHGAVGKGWKPLVQRAIEKFREREEKAWFWWKRIYVAQIKEKYGTLRIYVDFPSDWYFDNVINGGDEEDILNKEVEDFLWELDCESSKVCEKCGKTVAEDPTVKTAGPGWILTLCDTCRNMKSNSLGSWEMQENTNS